MKRLQNQIFGLLFIFASMPLIIFPQSDVLTTPTAENFEIAEKVKRAFDSRRKYDSHWEDEIKPYGVKLIPYLKSYLKDPDDSVHLKVLNLLKDIKEAESIPLLAEALRDPSLDVSKRAALYLYDNYDHTVISQYPEVGPALRQGVTNGNKSIASIILLGYFPGRETEIALSTTGGADFYWSAKKDFVSEIKLATPIFLTLYRLNAPDSYQQLIAQIRTAKSDEIEFLLYALEFVDDPAILKLVFEKGFADRRVPYSEYGNHGRHLPNARRVADLTVDKFAEKLGLTLGFEMYGETAYSPKKLSAARQKIAATLAVK